jgi:hypothetical protein
VFTSGKNDLGMVHENGGNVALETKKYQANAAIMIDKKKKKKKK